MRAISDLDQVLEFAREGPSAQHIRVDPYLARGLSYYTGPIFEVEFKELATSGGGGGRYDELIGIFSGRKVPACGFSLGLERIILIMEQRGLFPERISGQPEVLVTQFSEETIGATLKLAQTLRNGGLRVDLYPSPGKYGKQFKYADQRKIRFAVLLSTHEIESGVVLVKDLVTGQQEEMVSEKLVIYLRERLTAVS